MVFEKTGEERQYAPNGDVQWLVSGETVATGTTRTQPGKFTLAGDGLCIGWDSADAVSADYHATSSSLSTSPGSRSSTSNANSKDCSLATDAYPTASGLHPTLHPKTTFGLRHTTIHAT